MSNLGLGLIAADEYFREGDRRALRERDAARFDWESQRSLADLSTLPEKTEAQRSGYVNQRSANEAQIETRPGQTANTVKRQGQESYGLDRAGARQPAAEDAKDAETTITGGLLGAKVEDLPRIISEQKRQGILDSVTAGQAALKGLGQLIDAGDTTAVVKFMNDMDAVSPDTNNRFGAPVAQVGLVPNPQDPADHLFVALDADGKPLRQISMSKLRQLTNGPGETKVVKPGETIGTVGPRGDFTPSYTAPETRADKLGKMGPLERDVAYLTSEHGMTNEKALDYLRSAKTKTREQFVLDGLSAKMNSGLPGKGPTEADVQELSNLYDKVQGGGGGTGAAATAPASSPVAPGAAPRTAWDLIGVPQPKVK